MIEFYKSNEETNRSLVPNKMKRNTNLNKEKLNFQDTGFLKMKLNEYLMSLMW